MRPVPELPTHPKKALGGLTPAAHAKRIGEIGYANLGL